MDELRRILQRDNMDFISEVKERWVEFCKQVQFYGVFKKVLKSPVGMSKGRLHCLLLIIINNSSRSLHGI